MSLDGLRAWIGEVERKLGMRTRVFLFLAVIAIGGAGAGIYLAIDTRESAVGESDVRAFQEELEARIGAGGGAAAGTSLTQLQAEVKALQSQVDRLSGGGGGSPGGAGGGGTGGGGEGEGTSGGGSEGAGSIGTTGEARAKLQDLLEGGQEESGNTENK